MEESERLKAEKADAEKKALDAEERALRAERKATLAGKVADPNAALKLIEESHLDSSGNVNVDALLKDFPFLKPATQSPPLDGGNPPGGGKPAPKSLADAVSQHYSK